MKLVEKHFLVPFILGTLVLFLGNSGNPPDGYTGAPFNSSCGSCHGGGSYNGNLTVTGFPTTILPSTTYDITITATATMGSPAVGGFQLVTVNAANQNSGDLINTSGQTGTTTVGGREYIDQRGAKAYSNGTVSWNFQWTSPNGPNGAVITMYYSSNMANGNSSTSGDKSITGFKSGTMMGGGNPLNVSITQKKNVSCFGGSDGEATATATGGTSPYSYIWTNGKTTNKIDQLVFNNYAVTVTDNAGATSTANALITQPAILEPNVTILKNVSCPGGKDGAVTTTASGGTPPYNFVYSSGVPNNLFAGNYIVTVSDANQCSSIKSFNITQPDTFKINTSVFQNPGCPLDSNGIIRLSVSGANSPYKYLWSTNDTNFQIINKKTGTYKVTITDQKNCTANRTYELKSVDTIPPQISSRNGNAYLGINGWTIPNIQDFIFVVNDNCDPKPKLSISIDTFRCNMIGKNTYIISAVDVYGNKSTSSVEIQLLDTLKPFINKWPDTVIYSCNIVVPQITATDNCGIVDFKKIQGPEPGSPFPEGNTVIIYSAMDPSNNLIIDSFKVTVKQAITLSLDTLKFSYCNGDTAFHLFHCIHHNNESYKLITNKDTFRFTNEGFFEIKSFDIDTLKFFLVDSSGCIVDIIRPINYPGAIVHLDTVLIKNESGINTKDGALNILAPGADSISIIDALSGMYVNNTGLNLAAGDYIIKIFKEGCEFIYGPYTIKLILNTDYKTKINIHISPNPLNHYIDLIPESDLPIQYILFNSDGEGIITGQVIGVTKLDLSQISSGVYFLKFKNQKISTTFRLIKI